MGHMGSKLDPTAQIYGKTLKGNIFSFTILDICQKGCLDDFSSSLNIGHLGPETSSHSQNLEKNLLNTLESTILVQIAWNLVRKEYLHNMTSSVFMTGQMCAF
jgi:hypothetical protein